jgi:hypothetical protein
MFDNFICCSFGIRMRKNWMADKSQPHTLYTLHYWDKKRNYSKWYIYCNAMYLTSNTLDYRLCIIRLSLGWQLNFSPCMKDIVLGMAGKLLSFLRVHILGKSHPNINRRLSEIRTVNSSQCCSSNTDLG